MYMRKTCMTWDLTNLKTDVELELLFQNKLSFLNTISNRKTEKWILMLKITTYEAGTLRSSLSFASYISNIENCWISLSLDCHWIVWGSIRDCECIVLWGVTCFSVSCMLLWKSFFFCKRTWYMYLIVPWYINKDPYQIHV